MGLAISNNIKSILFHIPILGLDDLASYLTQPNLTCN
jgi:hypothetical protein